jgi:S1-C subfamily serine protease
VEITDPEQWHVRAARTGVGDTVTLGVTRRGAQSTMQLSMAPPPDQSAAALGLVMRPVPRVGAEVMRVNRGSAGEAAGILAGDLITAIGSVTAPTPAQVRSAFASVEQGDLLIVAVRRGGAHRVMAIQR